MDTFTSRLVVALFAFVGGVGIGLTIPHPKTPTVLECTAGPMHCDCVAPCKCEKMECGGADCSVMKLKEDIDAIYKLISDGHTTAYVTMDTEARIYHYIAGHDFRNPILNCPECGLIKELEKRKNELYNETVRIGHILAPDEPSSEISRSEHDELVARLATIHAELSKVEQHIHAAGTRASELGKQMKAE